MRAQDMMRMAEEANASAMRAAEEKRRKTADAQSNFFQKMMGQNDPTQQLGPMGAAMGGQATGYMPAGGASGGPVNAPWATMPTGETAAQVRAGLIARGMPEHVADGFMLNFQDESAFNPSAVGDNGNAFGLAQWNGPRMRALQDYAASAGSPVSDIDVQLDYLMTELQGPENAAYAAATAAQTPQDAAIAILNRFERPAETYRAQREAAYRGADVSAAAPQPSTAQPTSLGMIDGQQPTFAQILPNLMGMF